MPYFPDGSLRDRLTSITATRHVYSIQAASSIIYYLADALSYAHAQQVIHRDLKPENILFAGHEPVLADWGIGKFIHRQSKVITGAGMGTYTYCAPEQWHEGHSDCRSDIYSLGIIFRELLTGSVHGQVSEPNVNAVILNMTMPHPTHRYPSMNHVKAAIRCLGIVNTEQPMDAFMDGAKKIALTLGVAYLVAKIFDRQLRYRQDSRDR